jgi:Uncharacterized protein conserved in bacteria
MAQGLLRGYTQLWEPLDNATKTNIVNALKSSRVIKPGENNWLLFSAIIEAFLIKSGNGGDVHPLCMRCKNMLIGIRATELMVMAKSFTGTTITVLLFNP